MESDAIHARGVVMRAAVNHADAPGAESGWLDWLRREEIPALTGVDTRAVVRYLRDRGSMRGGIFPADMDEATAMEHVQAETPMSGLDLAREVTPSEAIVLGEGNDGPRIIAIDTGIKGSIVRNLLDRGARVELHPCTASAADLARARRRRLLPGQRPGRPGGAGLRRRHAARAGGHQADVRHLPGPPAAVPRGRPGDVQAAFRPPRRQPPGQGPGDRHGGDHLPEPRLRGRRAGRRAPPRHRRAGALGDRLRRRRSCRTSTSTTAPSRGSRCSTSPAAPCSTTPRRGQGRTTRSTSSTVSWSRSPMPRRDDIHKILVLGSGPIVIGQAAEFDYSGVQACKVLLEEGYEVVLCNSNPATIMTDPEFATATYVEPLLPGPGRADHRQGAPRRAAAHARRPDRAEPRPHAARGRHAGALRRGADRRQLRRDRPRRGPRPVPPDDGGRGAAHARVGDRYDGGRGDGRGRDASACR